MSADAVFQPLHMRRMYQPFRGQVRSHKIQFLQWVTGCLIRAAFVCAVERREHRSLQISTTCKQPKRQPAEQGGQQSHCHYDHANAQRPGQQRDQQAGKRL